MHASGWMGRLIAFSLIRLLSSPLMGRLIAFSLSRLLSSPLSSPLSDSLSGPQPSEKGLSRIRWPADWCPAGVLGWPLTMLLVIHALVVRNWNPGHSGAATARARR